MENLPHKTIDHEKKNKTSNQRTKNRRDSQVSTRSVKRGFAATLPANVLLKVFGFVSGVLAARLLGPEGRGELATILMYFSIIAVVGILGIQQSVAKEISKTPENENSILKTGLFLAFIVCIPQFLLLYLLAPYLLPSDKSHLSHGIVLAAINLFPAYVGYVLLASDQGSFRFTRYSIFRVLPNFGYVIGISALWLTGTISVYSFVLAFLISQYLCMILRLSFSGRGLVKDKTKFHQTGNLFRQGLLLHLPQTGFLMISRIDMLVLVYCVPSEQVGLYAIAYAIAFAQIAIIEALSQVSFVKIAGEKEREKAIQILVSHFRKGQVISIIILGLLFPFLSYIIQITFGEAFLGATQTTYLLVGGWSLLGLAYLLDIGLRALGFYLARSSCLWNWNYDHTGMWLWARPTLRN